MPTGTSLMSFCVPASNTASVFDRLIATYATLPSAENAMPDGTAWLPRAISCPFPGTPSGETGVTRTKSGPLRDVSPDQISLAPGRKAMPV